MLTRLLLLVLVVGALGVAWRLWRRPPALDRVALSDFGVRGPAVVQFTTESCGPCKVAAPRLAEAAGRTGLAFAQVDVGADPQLGRKYGIRTVPTIFVAGSRGQVLGTWTSLPENGIIEETARRAAAT